uniref:MSP domain-containing protein n=1 Tax=Panagrellus redivivus TaxID=6233 RepID=A0A7E4UUD3_PANRE
MKSMTIIHFWSKKKPYWLQQHRSKRTTRVMLTLVIAFISLGQRHASFIARGITNAGGRRIGWAIKTTNMKRLGVDPPCGVLDPKENVLMAVSCDSFQYGQEDTNNDRITIEWTN